LVLLNSLLAIIIVSHLFLQCHYYVLAKKKQHSPDSLGRNRSVGLPEPVSVYFCTMPGKQYQAWMVTTNDPNWELKVGADVQFFAWQPEEPPGVGWHRQCYVEFVKRLGGKGVSVALGQPALKKGEKTEYFYRNEPRNGSQESALAYCTSEKYCHDCHQGDHNGMTMTYDWSYTFDESEHTEHATFKIKGRVGQTVVEGTPMTGRGGKRSGAGQGDQQQKLLADIKAGKGRKYIFEEYVTYCERYHAWVDKAFTLFAPVRKWAPAVYWIWGACGTDKSRLARALCVSDCYCKPPDSRWFDGYDGQSVLILNDLRKSTFTYSYLLDLLDRYEFRVEVKGGYTPMLAKVVVITCSKSHATLWRELGGAENECLGQLTRRITEEFELPADDDAKRRLLHRMRRSMARLKDEESWDEEAKYGDWDGEEPVPAPPMKKLKVSDDSMTS
jgi:hypothetical protein